MDAKNTAETDDQIIDLTELIEKGEVPANDLSAQSRPPAHTEAEAEQEALNAQLRDLNDGSNVGDAEIDDLLAQMDIKNDGETDPSDVALDFAPPTTLTDHTVDPNEQLNMPGMGDVDNLLNSLDIPPQPGEREPEAAAPANADQAVDALLNDFNAATPAPQTAAAPAAQPAEAQSSIPDLDELLASVSPASPTGNLGGIDDLLNADRNAGQAQAPTARDDDAQSGGFGQKISDMLFGSGRKQGVVQSVAKQTTRNVGGSIGRSVGSAIGESVLGKTGKKFGGQIGNQIVRGILGSIFGGRR